MFINCIVCGSVMKMTYVIIMYSCCNNLKKALFESGNVWIFRNIIIERYNKTELYMIVLIHVLNLFNGQ